MTVVLIAAGLGGSSLAESIWGSAGGAVVGVTSSALLLIACLWKGTGPGGPRKREQFERSRAAQRRVTDPPEEQAPQWSADEVRANLLGQKGRPQRRDDSRHRRADEEPSLSSINENWELFG